MSPLMVFAAEGDVQSVTDIIEAGNNVNNTDYRGATALMYAAMNQHLEIAQALLDAGANPKIEDQKWFYRDGFC